MENSQKGSWVRMMTLRSMTMLKIAKTNPRRTEKTSKENRD